MWRSLSFPGAVKDRIRFGPHSPGELPAVLRRRPSEVALCFWRSPWSPRRRPDGFAAERRPPPFQGSLKIGFGPAPTRETNSPPSCAGGRLPEGRPSFPRPGGAVANGALSTPSGLDPGCAPWPIALHAAGARSAPLARHPPRRTAGAAACADDATLRSACRDRARRWAPRLGDLLAGRLRGPRLRRLLAPWWRGGPPLGSGDPVACAALHKLLATLWSAAEHWVEATSTSAGSAVDRLWGSLLRRRHLQLPSSEAPPERARLAGGAGHIAPVSVLDGTMWSTRRAIGRTTTTSALSLLGETLGLPRRNPWPRVIADASRSGHIAFCRSLRRPVCARMSALRFVFMRAKSRLDLRTRTVLIPTVLPTQHPSERPTDRPLGRTAVRPCRTTLRCCSPLGGRKRWGGRSPWAGRGRGGYSTWPAEWPPPHRVAAAMV